MRWIMVLAMVACASSRSGSGSETAASPDDNGAGDDNPGSAPVATGQADVREVASSGSEGAYTFAVTLRSDDEGCSQYADWWEVITPEGALLYRRILAHSHVSEQPFTRTGGPVPVDANQEVIVRGHMNPQGYGGAAMRGSVEGGFAEASVEEGFGGELENVEPLPTGCAY